MNKLLIELNRGYIKNKINKEVDLLFDEIKKQNKIIEECKSKIKRLEENKLIFARAYARKIGVILTQKKYNKNFVKAKGDVQNG